MIAPLQLFSRFLDAVLPPHEDVRRARAVSPRELNGLLCPHAASAAWICALFPYRDPRIRALVRAVKYHGETRALAPAASIMGEYILETLSEKRLLSGWEIPLLVPMPAAPRRLRQRGYNQAERIARAALPAIGSAAEFSPRALAREDRESQVSMERSRRSENIRNAFYVPDVSLVSGKSVVLVDDVVESGSTFSDARRALRRAGAQGVIGIALAH
jgi:predicted amidophosphoribosyltransferase